MQTINAKNQGKTISANSRGIVICYTDSKKHVYVNYDNRVKMQRPRYQELESSPFNERQERMYLEALYGTSIYSDEILNKMPTEVVIKIATRSNIVQQALNKWKQEIVNQSIDDLLSFMFPKSSLVKSIVNMPPDDTVRCSFTFKQLGLNQMKIAQKLVALSLLPSNFFNL